MTRTTMLKVAEIRSPIGRIRVAAARGRLCALGFVEDWSRLRRRLEQRFGRVEFRPAEDPCGIVSCLRDYFAGDLTAFRGIRVDPGGTRFQRRVWKALRKVTVGRTVSYRDLARTIGAPGAARAVGAANGSNPIGIVIPCHRVITAGGGLGGYAGGIERKRWLLMHERTRDDR